MAKNKKYNLDSYKRKSNEINYSGKNITKKETNRNGDEVEENLSETNNEYQQTESIDLQNLNIYKFFIKYQLFIWPALLVLITFFVFKNALDNQFVNWDDDRYVTGNKYLQDFTWANIKYFFSNFYFVMYIPITMISYMFDYYMVGLKDPGFYHTHNVIIHLINTGLLFIVIFKLSKIAKNKNPMAMAVITTFMWCIATLRVESVTWISERKDLLYSMFYFGAMLAYLFYTQKQNRKLYVLSLVLFLLSCMSKAMGVMVFGAIILIDYLLGRFSLTKTSLKHFFAEKQYLQREFLEKVPFFVIALIFGFLAILANLSQEPFALENSTAELITKEPYPLYENLLYASYGYINFLIKSFYPFHLSAIHPYPEKPDGAIPTQFWFYPLPVIAIAAVIVWAVIKNYRYLAFGLAFFTANLILVLQIISYQSFIMTERYSYMSSVGLYFIAAWGYVELTGKDAKYKQLLNIVLAAFLLYSAISTYNRNDVWQNSGTLWDDVQQKYPQVIVAYYNGGNYYQEMGDKATAQNNMADSRKLYDTAIKNYTRAIEINDLNVGALSNRGITYAKIGEVQKAISDFQKVIQLDSNFANIYSNLGNAYIMTGNYYEAIKNYNRAIKGKTDFYDAYYNRGVAKSYIGDFNGSDEDLNKALKMRADNANIYLYLGLNQYNRNNFAEAFKYFDESVKKDNTFALGYYYRAVCYDKQNMPEKATEDYAIALKLNPVIPKSILDNGIALENSGNIQAAIEKYNEALRVNPAYSEAYASRGIAKGKVNNFTEAFKDFNKAIELDSNNANAYANRGFAYSLTGNDQKALDDYNIAIKKDNKTFIAYYNRGLLLWRLKKYNEAISDLTLIINANPNSADSYYYRGLCYAALNARTEACTDLNKSLQLGQKAAEAQIKVICK